MRIAVLDDYQGVVAAYAAWDTLDAEVDFVHEVLRGEDLVARLAEADVVVATRERTPVDAALLDRLPRLRLLVTTGMNNAAIDLSAAHERGVTVSGTRNLVGPAAELTWALLLATLRHVPQAHATMRDGGWHDGLPPGLDLAGRTLGLVGLGRLGQRVARVGLAFEMEVLAWSQHLDHDLARSLGVEPVGKEELLRRSDAVSLHLRLSERSRGVVGAAELATMKPSAVLVNTSRGPLVDEAALLDALERGVIAGAGLDVFDTEPLPADHPLRRAPHLVLTPHLGYVTDGGYRLVYGDAVDAVRAWAAGKPIRMLEA